MHRFATFASRGVRGAWLETSKVPNNFKKLVRARMAKTGEAYQAAARQVRANAPLFSAGSNAPNLSIPDGGLLTPSDELGAVGHRVSVDSPMSTRSRKGALEGASKMRPTIRIAPGELRKLVDTAVEVLRDNPVVAREEIFSYSNVLHQRINLHTRRLPLSQLRLVLAEVAVWEKQTARGWKVVDPPNILRNVAARAPEWAPPGKVVQAQSIPACWCEPDSATAWLKATGWTIKGERARRLRSDIPAPQPDKLYDLHDVTWEEGVGGSEVVRRIVEWSGRSGIANVVGGNRDGLPTFQQIEALGAPL